MIATLSTHWHDATTLPRRSRLPRVLACIAFLAMLSFPFGNAQAWDITNRWTNTKTDGGGNSRGDALTLLWSLVPDGESWSRGGPSDLIDYLDVGWNVSAANRVPDLTNRPWWQMMDRVYEQYERTTGLTLTYEPEQLPDGTDTGKSGDLRVGGVPFTWENDKGGVLADNSFPNNGDMRIDTYRGSNGVPSFWHTNNAAFRNLISHETGHGMGLSHSDISGANAVMETPLETNFWGLQFDDIYALNRLYGDPLEKNGGNDTSATAYDFGRLDIGSSFTLGTDATNSSVNEMDDDWVGIDGSSDEDWFSFLVIDPIELNVTVTPIGPSYTTQEQGSVNAASRSNLNFTVYDTNGTSVLTNVNSTGIGQAEQLSFFNISTTGRYYIRVEGTEDTNQFYRFDISASTAVPNDLNWVGRFSSNWDALGESNFSDTSGLTVFNNYDNVTFADGALSNFVNIPADVLAGTIVVSGSGAYQFSGAGGIVVGSISIDGTGALELSNAGNGYSGPTNVNSGALIVTTETGTGTTTVADGAEIRGIGTVRGDLNNAGLIKPGGSIGTLTVLGSLTLEMTSEVEVELGLTTNDVLDVGGVANFDGELRVLLTEGLIPSVGMSFDIFDFGSAFGSFDVYSLPALDVGMFWDTSQLDVTGELSVLAGLQGDFDLDNDVDGNDFMIWQRNVGLTAGATVADGDADLDGDVDEHDLALWQENLGVSIEAASVLSADFDGDGNVDGADFLVWQRSFGIASGAALLDGDADFDGDVDHADLAIWQANMGTNGSSVAGVVPEPSSFVLFGFGTLVAIHSLRRKRL